MNPLLFPKSASPIQSTDLDQFTKKDNSKKLEKFAQLLVKSNEIPRFANQYCRLRFLSLLQERQNDFIDRTLYTKVLSVLKVDVKAPKELSKLHVRLEGKDEAHCTIPKESLESFAYFNTMLESKLKESKTDEGIHTITCRLPSGELLSLKTLECLKAYVFNEKIVISDSTILDELHAWAHLLNDTGFQDAISKLIIEYLSDEEHVQEFDKNYVEGFPDAFVERYLQKRGLDSSDMSVINFLHLAEKNSASPALEFVMNRIDTLHITCIGNPTIHKLQFIPKKIRKCIHFISPKESFLLPSFTQLELLLDLFPNAQYTNQFLDTIKDSLKKLKDQDYTGFCHYLAAEHLIANKSYNQALASLTKAIEIDPKNAFALERLGSEILFNNGALDKAKELLSEGLAIRPKKSSSLGYLGAILRIQGDFEEAKKSLNEALRLDPRNIFALANLGDVLRQQGALVEAEQIFNEVLKRDSNNVLALSGLGDVLRQQGAFAQAEQSFQAALRNDSTDVLALSGFADVLCQQGHLEKAEMNYKQALKIDPKNVLVLNGLPDVLCRQKKFKEALEVDPENVVALCGFGNVLRYQNQPQEAEMNYKKALKIDPNNAVALDGLPHVLCHQEKFREVLEIDPNNFSALSGLGKTMREQGQLDEAEKNYKKALEMTPKDFSWNRENFNKALNELAKLKEDKKKFSQLLKNNSQNDSALSGLGDVLRQESNLEEAKALFTQALGINPKNALALSGLADVLRQQGNLETAKEKYNEALKIDRENIVALSGLADVLLQQGNRKEAKEHLLKAYGIDQDHVLMRKSNLWPMDIYTL